jgi:hypothetical protein
MEREEEPVIARRIPSCHISTVEELKGYTGVSRSPAAAVGARGLHAGHQGTTV